MPAIFPIPSGRISSVQIQQRMLAQMNATQLDLLKLETQLTTGRRLTAPSDDPPAAARAIALQRLLEQKAQAKSNLAISNSFLSASETALSGVSQLLNDVRGTAVTLVNATTTEQQRQAASVEIQRVIEQLLTAGNQKFRGRYLFAGSKTTTQPFQFDGRFVVYQGNTANLPSFVDLDLLFATNVPGNEVFGAISPEVQSNVDLNPVLTSNTRLDDLLGGLGIARGSFIISDGTTKKTIDITAAETIGDVMRLIETNAPTGRQLDVRIINSGLSIELADKEKRGNLTITEVNNGTTAKQLGILETTGVGTSPILGTDLNPRLRLTTRLDDILGVKAKATVTLAAEVTLNGLADANAAVRVTATTPGMSLANVTIRFNPTSSVSVGSETATYDAATKTLTVSINDQNATTAANVAVAIDSLAQFSAVATGAGSINGSNPNDTAITAVTRADRIEITAINPGTDFNNITISIATQSGIGATPLAVFDDVNNTLTITIDNAAGASLEATATAINSLAEFSAVAVALGDGRISATNPADTSATALTAGGSGIDFDQESGIQIINGGQTFTITFRDARTIEDVLNIINGSGANVIAEVNESGTGLDLRSQLSGVDLHVGENGGTTATELGIRTFAIDTLLADLNHGRGVESVAGVTDFTISNNGFDLDVNVSPFQTVGQLLDFINTNHPSVLARLVATGNGIELVDTAAGGGQLTLTRSAPSAAAFDLGLLPPTQSQAGPAAPGGSLMGTDTNPLETKGAFNALIRLKDAVDNFDVPAIERAVALLDDVLNQVNFARAEIGTRGQTLDRLHQRLEDEEVQVRQALSLEIDTDFLKTISALGAQQAALEASLRLIGQTFRLSLLDFL